MFGNVLDVVTSLGVVGVAFTVWSVRRSNRLNFEQHFTDRYRDVVARIPLRHLRGHAESHRDGDDPDRIERAYFDYFELCEEQFYYRKSGRITNGTWRDWEIGIRSNGRLASFGHAWSEFADVRSEYGRANLFEKLSEAQLFEGTEIAAPTDPIERWRWQAILATLHRRFRDNG